MDLIIAEVPRLASEGDWMISKGARFDIDPAAASSEGQQQSDFIAQIIQYAARKLFRLARGLVY